MEQERVCYRGSHTRLLEPEAEPGETRFCSVWWRAKRECERERVRERERERERAREGRPELGSSFALYGSLNGAVLREAQQMGSVHCVR